MRKLRLKVEDPPNRKHMVFLGGAVLADLMKVSVCVWVGGGRQHGVEEREGGTEHTGLTHPFCWGHLHCAP